jgi:hypothetical protein
MTRFNELNLTVQEVLAVMASGNACALNVLIDVLNQAVGIDKQNMMGGMGIILFLDTCRIYGPRIWLLYKDVCNESINTLLAVLRAHQLGFLSRHDLNSAIDGELTIDVHDLCLKVKDRLPDFKLAEDITS